MEIVAGHMDELRVKAKALNMEAIAPRSLLEARDSVVDDLRDFIDWMKPQLFPPTPIIPDGEPTSPAEGRAPPVLERSGRPVSATTFMEDRTLGRVAELQALITFAQALATASSAPSGRRAIG